jgi:hypothetical protein
MSITNTPGTYPVTIIAAELGELGPGKDALKLTYQASDGGTIAQLLCLWDKAGEISMRSLDKALGYKFEKAPETLVGKTCEVVTDNNWNEKKGKSYYGVKYLNATGGGKALDPAKPTLLAQLAARAKALPPEAPRPPRAAGPAPAARRPAPAQNFADDGSEPF